MREEQSPRAETDRLGLGDLRIKQHPAIFKFTVDPILLAGFARIRPRASVLDLGTGAGRDPALVDRLPGHRAGDRFGDPTGGGGFGP